MLTNSVPGGAVPGMFDTRVKLAERPAASTALVQVTVPPEPTGGVLQTNAGPADCVIETNVIPAGMESLSVTVAASSAPRFPMVMSYATSELGAASAGPVFVTAMSATWPKADGTAITVITAAAARWSTN
jgi:hypothetical protein